VRLGVILALVLALGAPGCDSRVPTLAERSVVALRRYRSSPTEETYNAFIALNREAARTHGVNHDAEGVEYQLRALEVMAAEAERRHDTEIAGDVLDRLHEIDEHDQGTAFEDVVPGARERLAKVRATAAKVNG
jgi:hypothetical protein